MSSRLLKYLVEAEEEKKTPPVIDIEKVNLKSLEKDQYNFDRKIAFILFDDITVTYSDEYITQFIKDKYKYANKQAILDSLNRLDKLGVIISNDSYRSPQRGDESSKNFVYHGEPLE